MKFIEWTKDLEIGVNLIDNQHKKLVGLINKVYGAVDSEEKKKVVGEVLIELIEFSRVHFATEEKYFIRFKYKNTEDHITEHNKITLKVLRFQDRFKKEGVKILPEFLIFLKMWFYEHLKTMDQKYVKCFKNNGLR